MTQKTKPDYQRDVFHLTLLSICFNVFLTIIKFLVGILFGSVSLFADALHSLTDLVTDFVVMLGVKLGNQPPDDDHHYGHGKFETFAELIVATFIFVAGASVVYTAFNALFSSQPQLLMNPIPVVITCVASILVKELLFQITKKASIKWNSDILKTNAWHHRTDSLSSLVVIFGMIGVYFGFLKADLWAGILVGFFIVVMGVKIFKKVTMELLETTPHQNYRYKVAQVVNSFSMVKNCHNIRVRKMGSRLFMDMHIMVDPQLTVKVSHDLSVEIELKLREIFGNKTNILIHVEPFEKKHRDLSDFD